MTATAAIVEHGLAVKILKVTRKRCVVASSRWVAPDVRKAILQRLRASHDVIVIVRLAIASEELLRS